jgi:hypothetical protein
MNQMRVKSSIKEVRGPITAPRTEPTMTPAWWEWNDDDSTLIADEDMMEDEGNEGNGESVVGLVGVEVRKDGEVEYMRIQCRTTHSRVPEVVGFEVTGHRCFHYRNRKVEQSIFESDAKRFAISCKAFKRGEELDAHGGLNENRHDIISYWGIKESEVSIVPSQRDERFNGAVEHWWSAARLPT